MKTASILFGLILGAAPAFAGTVVYNCQLNGSSDSADSATLVYYEKGIRADWIPDDQAKNLKTTKANAEGHAVDGNEIQFTLFGFQDQADYLLVPSAIATAPKSMNVYTYHDDDDEAKDRQNFTCTK